MKTDRSHNSFRTGWRPTIGATTLLGLAAVVVYLAPWGNLSLEFSRRTIAGGEIWRLLTCHWTHFSFEHFVWNLLPFVWLGALCERRDRQGFLLCTIGSALAISVYVFLFVPELSSYRGLSGLDSALFGFIAVGRVNDAVKARNRMKCLLLGLCASLFAAKIGYETVCRAPLFVSHVEAGFVPVPGAHAVGFLVGATTVLLSEIKNRIQSVATGSGSVNSVSLGRVRPAHTHSSPAARSTAL